MAKVKTPAIKQPLPKKFGKFHVIDNTERPMPSIEFKPASWPRDAIVTNGISGTIVWDGQWVFQLQGRVNNFPSAKMAMRMQLDKAMWKFFLTYLGSK